MNVGEWVLKRALIEPERLFVQEGDLKVNNLEFNLKVNRVARTLKNLGASRGDRVVAVMDNCLGFLELIFACAKTGLMFAPVSPQLAPPDLAHILTEAEPRIFIFGREASEKVAALPETVLQGIRVLPLGKTQEDAFSLEETAAEVEEIEPSGMDQVGPDDPYLLLYVPSPGGDLRGVVLTHENILFGAIHSLISYGVNKTFKSLVLAPMSQIGALSASVFSIVYGGGALVLANFYHPGAILDLIREQEINYLFAVPVMFQMMAKAPEWPLADFSKVRYFISGGAPLPVEVIQKYQNEKGIRFPQGYGMTEGGRLTCLDLDDTRRKAGSVGKEVFHLFLKILDHEGEEVPAGLVGEIAVKGPNVFKEYWKRPDETRAAFKNGWFHTGDLGRKDDEGFIFLVGRKTDLIISSGRNIYPAEVERAIRALAGVKETAVVGLPDPQKGQIVAALIVSEPETYLTRDHILGGLSGWLADYKFPRIIKFSDQIPKKPDGTIDGDGLMAILGR